MFREAQKYADSPEGKAQAADVAEYGAEPAFHVGPDGKLDVPSAVERAIRGKLRDPDSFQPLQALGMEKTTHQDVKCYKIRFSFAAANGLGGMNTALATVWMRGSDIIDMQIDGL